MEPLTRDSFFNGSLRVGQDRTGYRFSIDAVLLAHSFSPEPGSRILDLGTGCGIIPLILAYRYPGITIVGVEIQAPLAAAARQNVSANGMADRIEIFCQDFRALPASLLPPAMDWVVSNPPYHPVSSGRINPNAQRAIARHELCATLQDVIDAAARRLKTGGRFAVVYPAERTVDLLGAMRAGGIEPKRLRTVQSLADSPAKMVMAMGRKGGRAGICVAPPLVVYQSDGSYTAEVAQMMQP